MDADFNLLKPTPGGYTPSQPAPAAALSGFAGDFDDVQSEPVCSGINPLVACANPLLYLAGQLRRMGHHPNPGALPYAAAKAGLNALTEGLSRAYGPSVRVNTIVPGPFFTDISKAWDMPFMERAFQAFALRRGGRPSEIVGAALYLASDASSYTTGSILRVDGGLP